MSEHDEQKVIDAAEERMEKLNWDSEDAAQEPESKQEQELEPKQDITSEPGPTPEPDVAPKPEPVQEPVDDSTQLEEPKADGEPSTLSDAHRRAAIHQGWKPDEIEELYKQNPDLAERTFSNIHKVTNNMSAKWAELGKVELDNRINSQISDTQPTPTPVPQPQSQPQVTPPTKFDGINLDQLREEYKDDPIFDGVVVPLNEALIRLHSSLNQTQEQLAQQTQGQQDQVDKQESEVVQKQVDQFFSDPLLKSYEGFYGNGVEVSKITPEHLGNRMEVLRLADQIVAGAMLQNYDISNEKAMELAHLSVSEPYNTGAIRNDIKDTLKKRNSNITLQPNSDVTTDTLSNMELTSSEVVNRAHGRLQKLFK